MIMNILYKFFTFRAFLIVAVPTLVVILLRLFLIKCGFDISDFVNNFYTCSIFLFLLNLIRFIVRDILEKFSLPTYLFYDNPNSLGEGSSNSNPDSNTNQDSNPNSDANVNPNLSQNVDQPVFYGNGFSYDGRVYTINDPTNVMNRGFLDPI